jgi:hypothetical protein
MAITFWCTIKFKVFFNSEHVLFNLYVVLPVFPLDFCNQFLLGWPKSFRKSVSWGNFYNVPKETHNIFKDFEDEMTTSEKKI